MDHLRAIDALRHGIGLRGYAQRDPKNEYKAEGFKLFEKLMFAIEDEVANLSLRVRVQQGPPGGQPPPTSVSGDGSAGRAAAGGFAGDPHTPFARRSSPPSPAEIQAQQQLLAARLATRRPPASAAFDAMRRSQPAPEKSVAPPKAAPVPKVDRNDPCPCGSGKKYKKCHGAGE
jgi:preprotein translocase subunit SecA